MSSELLGSSFVEEFSSNSLISTYPNHVRHFQKDLCNVVLEYINHVLMEDDDFENEIATATSSTLNATKRSFEEIFDGDNNSLSCTTTRNKYFANCADEIILHEMFGKKVLLDGENEESTLHETYRALPRKGLSRRQAIDMRNLLLQCVDRVGRSDCIAATTLLKEIKSQACIYGDATQRLAHYFSDGLEARLVGHEVQQHEFTAVKTVTDYLLLKAFKLYLTKFPFMETAYFFANEMIMEVAEKATAIHIIHFGIMHGLQWPPFIQRLSERQGRPPKLRITAIDFPQTGFRMDARVKETGRRLSDYCKKLKIPFEYNSISKNWDTVQLEELGLKKGEVVAINCMYYLRYLLDDTVIEQSPRDIVLNLMRSINPDIFVHVVTNGAYSSPFFVSRSREALFHYSTWFDMLDNVYPRESTERMVFEKDVLANELRNVITSEGFNRKGRPETFKQWQKRTTRAGFKPIPLNPAIVNEIQARVKLTYHKDFFIGEAGPWLLDGWKGRSIFALSCWKPAKSGLSHIL